MEFNLSDEIKNRRENIRTSTLKVYVGNLSNLNEKEPINNLDFLKDIDLISSRIEKYSIPTQRNYLTAAMVALSIYDAGDAWNDWKPIYDIYKKTLEDKTSDYQKTVESHAKSVKQEQNWITRKQQLKLINKYKRELKAINFDINAPSKMGIKIYQYLIIVSLYYYQAPRRLDYAPVKIIETRDEDDGEHNFLLVLNKNKKYFIFNKYKTSNYHGKQEIAVTKPLNKLLNDWLKINTSSSLLLNSQNKPLSSNGLGKMIPEAYKPSGIQSVTANILRHVYTTEMIGTDEIDKDKERKKIANDMAHSTTAQINYIKV